jgi:hypothetical protein
MAHSFIVVAALFAAKPTNIGFDWTGFWTTVIATAVGGFLGGFIALFSTIYQLKRTAKYAQRERDEERREREKEQKEVQKRERLAALKLLATDLRISATMAGVFGKNLEVGIFRDKTSAIMDNTPVVWVRMAVQALPIMQSFLHTVPPFVYEAVIKAGSKTARYNTIVDIQNTFQTKEPAYQLPTISGLAEAARIAQFQAADDLETYINGQDMEPAATKVSHTITVSLLLRGRFCDSYNSATDKIDRYLKNMAFLVKDENLQELGVGELDEGKPGPKLEDEPSCQYEAEIKGIQPSRFYVILLGEAGWDKYYESEYGGVAYTYADMEKLNWQVSLELHTGLTIPGERIVKAAN